MTDVKFYHLQHAPLEDVLPKLLEKATGMGLRAIVLAPTTERIESLNIRLWTYGDRTFLPHGSADDGFAAEQPIYLTTKEENPNRASVLALVDGADPDFLGEFERCYDLLDGRDEEAVAAARGRWSARKASGHEVSYWRQKPGGGWEQKP